MARRDNCATSKRLQAATEFGHFTTANCMQPSLCLNLEKHIPNWPEIGAGESVHINTAILAISRDRYILKSRFFENVLNQVLKLLRLQVEERASNPFCLKSINHAQLG